MSNTDKRPEFSDHISNAATVLVETLPIYKAFRSDVIRGKRVVSEEGSNFMNQIDQLMVTLTLNLDELKKLSIIA